jgi:GNAT superfamily N-acetyltransferase
MIPPTLSAGIAEARLAGAGVPDLRLERAQLADADAVVALFGALHHYNASLDPHFGLAENWATLLCCQFEETASHPDHLWMLGKDGNYAIGLLIAAMHTDSPMYRYRRWVEIEALYVADRYRGKHVAARLLAAAYRWAEERRVYRLQLYVTASNIRAQAIYASQGFAMTQAIMRKFV